MVNCSRKRKASCTRSPGCQWIVGKGCKKSPKGGSPRRVARKSLPRSCARRRKLECKSPCNWQNGKGCRGKNPKARRSKRRSVARKNPPRLCSRRRKIECVEPCAWTVGKGCGKGAMSPLAQPLPPLGPPPIGDPVWHPLGLNRGVPVAAGYVPSIVPHNNRMQRWVPPKA